MFPPRFEYVVPSTLDEALALLSERGEELKILAGGQSLIPLLKMRFLRPEVVMDINRLTALHGVRDEASHISIGGLVRHYEMATDPIVRRYLPWLADIVPLVGDPQIRTLGTVGGTLVEADPAGDWSAALLALDAEILVVSTRGRRTIRCREWFTFSFTPAIEADELVEEIRVRKPAVGTGGRYAKIERRAGDFAVAACAVVVALDSSRVCSAAGIGLTGVGVVPVHADEAAAALIGTRITDDDIASAVDHAQAVIQPMEDSRGSVSYKRQMAGVVLRRAARAAAAVCTLED